METPTHYAGFWKRFGAFIIDSVLISIVVGLLAGHSLYGDGNMMYGYGHGYMMPYMYGTMMAGGFLKVLLGWLYYALMESSKHEATLGKMALGIKVTDLHGARVSFGRATGRHFAKIISAIVFGIGFIMIAFTKHKQGLHDIIASTLVVNK